MGLQEPLNSQSVSYHHFFFFLFFLSLQTPELSILKTDCFIDYISFELCIVIGAFLKADIFFAKESLKSTRLETLGTGGHLLSASNSDQICVDDLNLCF